VAACRRLSAVHRGHRRPRLARGNLAVADFCENIDPDVSSSTKESIMKKNMGNADRIIRLIIAAIIAVLYFTGQISGTLAIILGIIAIAFLVTSIIGWCPIYVPFKISTCKQD
jgi:hypothetical protein